MCRPVKSIWIAMLCVAASLAPTTGFAQPGRSFTPPPTFTPPTFTPPTFNHSFQNQIQQTQQSNQSNQQMNRVQQQMQSDRSNQQSALQQMQQTRDRASSDMDASRRLTQQSQQTGRAANQGGDGQAANIPAHLARVTLTRVEANTQAARLGLRKGDVLVSYAGVVLDDPEHLQHLITLQPADGDPVELVVARNGQAFTVNAAPGRLGVLMRLP